MQDYCSEESINTRIRGIKANSDLVLINLFRSHAIGPAPIFLLQALADNKINISFLTRIRTESDTTCSCCVSINDIGRVACLVDEAISHGERVEVVRGVAAVSVFPHHYHLNVLGTVVGLLGQKGIPVLAMGTSLSTVTVVVDCRILPRVVALFGEMFDLPVPPMSVPPD